MFTFYLISIAAYILVMSILGRITVREGGTITVEEMFWYTVACFVPIINTIFVLVGCLFIFDHYKDRPVFGGEK